MTDKKFCVKLIATRGRPLKVPGCSVVILHRSHFRVLCGINQFQPVFKDLKLVWTGVFWIFRVLCFENQFQNRFSFIRNRFIPESTLKSGGVKWLQIILGSSDPWEGDPLGLWSEQNFYHFLYVPSFLPRQSSLDPAAAAVRCGRPGAAFRHAAAAAAAAAGHQWNRSPSSFGQSSLPNVSSDDFQVHIADLKKKTVWEIKFNFWIRGMYFSDLNVPAMIAACLSYKSLVYVCQLRP